MSSTREFKPVAALLLTGGASRRMGSDKALIQIDGEPLSTRIARLAAAVAHPVLEVGPGYTQLPVAVESAPGSGPLAALADGVRALRDTGHAGAALVLATDLVLIDAITLGALVDWRGSGSVVPLLDGRPQPLCARWSAADLNAVAAMVSAGERSMRSLLARPDVALTDAIDARPLRDADTPADLAALTLEQ